MAKKGKDEPEKPEATTADEFMEQSKTKPPADAVSFKFFLSNSRHIKKKSKYLLPGFVKHVESAKMHISTKTMAEWEGVFDKFAG